MFERFTERARQVVVLAQEEARNLGHGYIGTEHILLGLLREEEGLAARVLESLGITTDPARERVVAIVGRTTEEHSGQLPFTPRGKKVLEMSLREALSLGHNYIGTEHILLGLVREGEGAGVRVLDDMGATSEIVRHDVLAFLTGPRQPKKPSREEPPVGNEQDLAERLLASCNAAAKRVGVSNGSEALAHAQALELLWHVYTKVKSSTNTHRSQEE